MLVREERLSKLCNGSIKVAGTNTSEDRFYELSNKNEITIVSQSIL